ncbi:Alpha/Beta hydrolase protein [Microdochium trichocladiopsis]|uniref:Alpha/Beta hydrolase protein n=1 Tax=Microdochium trichocladiopsis TaxID=1682393 RepID=A0A9P8Y7S5_9PEZI|nr:Alpha/Beta hydrolase protein [Microdochium trichocladiopsis]KAH7032749.1 Alpha/Beta hydrolase protein [Microdochium trichocladiopsis]
MGFFDMNKKPKRPAHEPRAPVKVDHLGYPIAGPPHAQSHFGKPSPPFPSSTPYHHHHGPPCPAGLLLPQPQSCAQSQPSSGRYGAQAQPTTPPVIVNQHYYLSPPPSQNSSLQYPTSPYMHSNSSTALSKLKLGSAANLATELMPTTAGHHLNDGLPRWHSYGSQLLNQSAAMYDQFAGMFNDVISLIDRDTYTGNENALFMYQQPGPPPVATPSQEISKKTKETPKESRAKDVRSKGAVGAPTVVVADSIVPGGYFSKVEYYANSRLPMDLRPLRLYIPTYPLLCLAAQYSERVYEKPTGAESNAHVNADWKTGAKAMCIKSVPMDNLNTIVFAIRGTASFMDWSVNLNTAPTSPKGFLDDASNFCHAGFLKVARKMIAPVAARLRQMLEEDPRRASYSLLITGHSAGGAVAALLYMHMLSTSKSASSELNNLTSFFKRVHCVTFGAPPISIRPLEKPNRLDLRKSLFLSFINEGDPVTRADRAYVKSLFELFAAPTPKDKPPRSSSGTKTSSKSSDRKSSSSKQSSSQSSSSSKRTNTVWKVPACTLSNAGRLVVLRSGNPDARVRRTKTVEERLNEGVVAQVVTDEQLRDVIWGDPVCHVMRLYAARIEVLAVGAVTGKRGP